MGGKVSPVRRSAAAAPPHTFIALCSMGGQLSNVRIWNTVVNAWKKSSKLAHTRFALPT